MTFSQYIGDSNVQTKTAYPSDRSTVSINFGEDVTNYTFDADYQVLIIDALAFDRSDAPNYKDSSVIGTFAKVVMAGGDVPVVTNATNGDVTFTFPEDMYSGLMLPDARKNVPIVSVGFRYTRADGTTDAVVYAVRLKYEPGNAIGDPVLDVSYSAITFG